MRALTPESVAFYAVLVAVYWAAPRRFRAWIVTTAGVSLLLVKAPAAVPPLLGLWLVTWWLTRPAVTLTSRVVVALSVATVTLCGYKLGAQLQTPFAASVVPLGLSFYVLRCIHVGVERLKGELDATGAVELAAYLLFPPCLIIGPIHRARPFLRDLRRRRFSAPVFSRGLERIVYGFATCELLGNDLISVRLSRVIDGLDSSAVRLSEYLDCVRYGLNLYLQFSGYSSIAIGASLLLGIHVMENFEAPFLAPDIQTFWSRWHRSLTTWCRDYVFLPVLATTRRPALAVMTAMLVLGAWHEPSGRYLAWGFYHGLGIVAWHGYRRYLWPRLPAVEARSARGLLRVLSIAATANFVMIGFALTKEPDLASAAIALERLFGGGL